jgi:hypothetical protein
MTFSRGDQCCGSIFIESGSSGSSEPGSGFESGSRVLMKKIQLNFFYIFPKYHSKLKFTYPWSFIKDV